MKKILCIFLVLAINTMTACKKAEEAPAAGKQANNKQSQTEKRPKKKGGGVRGLQIFHEEKLIVAIPRDDFSKIMTTTVKIEGQDQKAILLSDLLKLHNVTGKNVVLKGPHRATNLSWAEATTNPIYIYPVKNRLQTFHESKALEDSKIPDVLVRIDVVENPVASGVEKAAKKPAK